MILYHARSIGDQFNKIRQMYEIHEIQNQVPDGKISFPEDSRSLASGVTIEFRFVLLPRFPSVTEVLLVFHVHRNVSFRYPNTNDFALRGVSFKIKKGQLCVSPVLSPFFPVPG
jgi:ABC-type multidrug transport system fused ATPase/permease subunit